MFQKSLTRRRREHITALDGHIFPTYTYSYLLKQSYTLSFYNLIKGNTYDCHHIVINT
jgi:hypothetical protein